MPRAPLAGRSAWALFIARSVATTGCYRCLMNDTVAVRIDPSTCLDRGIEERRGGGEAVGMRDIFTGRKVVFPRLLTSIFLRATFIDSPFTAES